MGVAVNNSRVGLSYGAIFYKRAQAMNIAANTIVTLHYSLYDQAGELIEKTDSSPIAYLHGQNNMIAGFEKALDGKAAGDKFSIELNPEEAYGARNDEALARVPVKHLQGAKKWRKGMVAVVNTDQGQRQVTILKVGRFMADVDTNHPLAGKHLRFDVDIIEVRAASAEEIDHGHAHGEFGHQH